MKTLWTLDRIKEILKPYMPRPVVDSTATVIEDQSALPAPETGPMLPYLAIFTPALLYFIDCALKDWEMAPEQLCGLSCESWMESHILNMQAKTPQGIDTFYWFITKFDYENYFQLHV